MLPTSKYYKEETENPPCCLRCLTRNDFLGVGFMVDSEEKPSFFRPCRGIAKSKHVELCPSCFDMTCEEERMMNPSSTTGNSYAYVALSAISLSCIANTLISRVESRRELFLRFYVF